MSYNLSIQPVEMPKPPEITGSTAVRPIAPPPLAHSPSLWFTFGLLAAGHFSKAFQSGYDAMADKELKQRVR
jgi:hypothetical protein